MSLKLLSVIYVALLTVLLTYDYFDFLPSIFTIPHYLIIGIFIGLVIVSIFVERKKETTSSLWWRFVGIVYITVLIFVFTLLGGESTVGLSFSSGWLWVVIGISLIDILVDWNKQRRSS